LFVVEVFFGQKTHKSATMKLCLVIFGLLAITAHGYEATMEDVVVEEGQNATFVCNMVGDDPDSYEIKWWQEIDSDDRNVLVKYVSKDDTAIEFENNFKGQNRFIAKGNELTILKAVLGDNELLPKISCDVEAIVGTSNNQASATATFGVVLFPTKPQGSISNRAGIFKVGDNQNVGECRSGNTYPAATIEFFKNGVVINHQSTDNINGDFFGFESDTFTEEGPFGQKTVRRDLFMDLTEEDDNAKISCQIITELGDVKDVKTIEVGTIRIEHQVSKVSVSADSEGPYKDGDEVTFTCTHNGYPSSYIANFGVEGMGENVDSPKTVKMTPDLNGKTLSCGAAIDGQDPPVTDSITLEVQFNTDVKVAQDKKGAVKYGDSVTLTCSSNTNPAASYKWLKNGEEIAEKTAATLTLDGVDFMTNGDYVCETSNVVGSAKSDPHSIAVQGLVLDSAASKDVPTENVEKLEMTCSVKASGQPSFAWTQTTEEGDKDVEASEMLMIGETKNAGNMYSQTLTIKEVAAAYSLAMFKCKAMLDGSEDVVSDFSVGEIKESGSIAGIIVAILVILLILVIIIGFLYYKGIICKKDGKSGEETADDIEVEIRKDDDVESGAVEGEKLLENGDN